MRVEHFSFGAGQATSSFRNCQFDGSIFSFVLPGYARLDSCTFGQATLQHLNADTLECIRCRFGGRIETAVFWGRIEDSNDRFLLNRDCNEFRDNDFSDADLIDVDFRGGIDLKRQILPQWGDYLYVPDAPTVVKYVKTLVTQWTSSARREHALKLLQVYEFTLGTGQEQLLLRLSADREYFPAVAEEIHAIMREHRSGITPAGGQ